MSSTSGRPTAKSRREHARATARLRREAEKRRNFRHRIMTQSGIIIALLAIVGIMVLLISQSTAPAGQVPRNMAGDGVRFISSEGSAAPVTTGPTEPGATSTAVASEQEGAVDIVTYIDFACPACRVFERTNGDQLASWVAEGRATLDVHPVAILDSASLGSKYSSRAANAAACVADLAPRSFLDVVSALFAGQPEEGTQGLTDSALTSLIGDAGADGADVASCISDRTFMRWARAASERATTGPLPDTDLASIPGTPTVLVDGVPYTGSITDAEKFSAFVEEAMAK